jgi:hypothetical protein
MEQLELIAQKYNYLKLHDGTGYAARVTSPFLQKKIIFLAKKITIMKIFRKYL